jgi:uncharacterized protein
MNNDHKYIGPSYRAFYGTLAFVILCMIPGLLIPKAKPFAYIGLLVFILLERRRRGRSWEEIGIKFRDIGKDIINNWLIILVVSIIIQITIPLIARNYWPELLQHIRERVPYLSFSSINSFILTVIIIAFFEELIFRGLLQQRLNWYLNGFISIIISSVVFGIQHFTPGNPAIVIADMFLVVVDGIFYGWIYFRSKNVFISWFAHVLADIVGFIILLII